MTAADDMKRVWGAGLGEWVLRPLTTSDVADIIDRAPISPLQVHAILVCLLVTVLDGFDTQCIAFVAPSISMEWHLARSDFAPVFSAGLAGTMLGSLLLAPLGDRLGRKPLIMVATLWFALFSLLTMLATNVWGLIVFRALTGAGLGTALPNVIALTIEYAPQRRRVLLTTSVVLGIAVGGITGGLMSSQLIAGSGWRSVFLAGGILPLLATPLAWFYLPESIRFMAARQLHAPKIAAILHRIDPAADYTGAAFAPVPNQPATRVPVGGLFTRGRAWRTGLIWGVFVANLFLLNLMINWLPSILHQAGLPVGRAILATTIFNIGGILGGLSLAQGVDSWGAYRILPAAYLVTAGAIVSVGWFSHSAALFVAIFFSGAGVIGAFSGVNVLSGTLYPTAMRATGVGWAFGIGRVGSILGPAVGGMMIALGWTVRHIFLFGAMPAVLAAAAIVALGRVTGRSDGN